MTPDWVRLAVAPPKQAQARSDAGAHAYGAALLFGGRFLDYRQESDDLGLPPLASVPPTVDSPEATLIAALAAYLTGGDPAPLLIPLILNRDLADSLRATSAVIASIALADRRELDQAIEVLVAAAGTTDRQIPAAWLRAHVACRLLESGRASDARDVADEVTRVLRTRKTRDEVVRVIEMSVDSTRRHAAWFMGDSSFMAEWPSDRSALRPIRDVDLLVEDGLAAQLSQQFNATFESPYTRTFGFATEDPVVSPLSAALLRAEMIADWGAATRVRGLIGKYQLLTSIGRSDRQVGSALMLLSRAREEQAIRKALSVYRSSGPLDVLSGVGESLAKLPWPMPQRKADIRILSEVSHLISVEAAGQAASRLLSDTDVILNQSGLWGRAEDVWLSAIAALLPSIPVDAQGAVSEALYALAVESDNPLVLQGMGGALVALRWDRLSRHDQDRWLAFARRHIGESSDRQFAAISAARGLAQIRATEVNRLIVGAYNQSGSLLHAALLLDLHRRPSRSIMLSIADRVVTSVARTRADASAGRYSMGTVRMGSMLGSVATRLRRRELWEAVLGLIDDVRAPSEMRADALAALSGAARVPKYVLRGLRNTTTESEPVLPFEEHDRLSGTWLRFRAVQGIGEEHRLLSDFLDLASSPTARARIEAAISVAALRSRVGNETLATATTMLSRDSNPHVRAAAARSLPLLVGEESALGRRVRERVQEILADPGDEAPLAALRGLAEDHRLLEDPAVLRQVALLSSRHPSRAIRDAATRLLV